MTISKKETLKEILEDVLRQNTWLDYTTLTKPQCVDTVRKWLQQKQPKLKADYTWNDGWSYDQKTIKKLLEEIE